jgi:hypothetical protein
MSDSSKSIRLATAADKPGIIPIVNTAFAGISAYRPSTASQCFRDKNFAS